jgi:hypothetical protein
MKVEVKILLLWAIALVATCLVVGQASVLTLLCPLYAICMIGSLVSIRRSAQSGSRR